MKAQEYRLNGALDRYESYGSAPNIYYINFLPKRIRFLINLCDQKSSVNFPCAGGSRPETLPWTASDGIIFAGACHDR
jgi:hypothetical protein